MPDFLEKYNLNPAYRRILATLREETQIAFNISHCLLFSCMYGTFDPRGAIV